MIRETIIENIEKIILLIDMGIITKEEARKILELDDD